MATPKLSDAALELGYIRDGYPALASWIARDTDSESLVFRRFNKLGARNILHLQAILTQLEQEIDDLDGEARQGDGFESKQSLRRWETLMRTAEGGDLKAMERVKKSEELRAVIREYYEFLLLQSQIAELKGPSARVLSACRDYVGGKAFASKELEAMPIISGRARDYLHDKADLVALRRPAEEDVLSTFLQNHWAFQKRTGSDPLDRTTSYKSEHVVRTVASISMALAAVLLIGAIVSLHVVGSSKAKLGLVAMFTLLFAVSVSLLTNARRAEVFASTAAYAAVLVVFVSGDLGGLAGGQCLIQLENGMFKTVRCPT